MQTGKIRRTVAKLQQLRDDFYAFPAADLTLWMIQRTDDSPRRKPPGMRTLFCVFTVETLDCSYYVTVDASQYIPPFLPSGLLPPDANELTNQKLSEMTQAFCSMIRRCDYLLKEANLIPEYSSDATLYAVTTLALNGDISTAKPYYWQGGTTFAASFAKDWPKSWTVPLSCLDWFVKIDELPEAVGDTIDELIIRMETAGDKQPAMQATIEQPTAEPSEPKQEASDKAVAFAFLLLWHRYDTKDFNSEPIPGRTKFVKWMQENADGRQVPSYSTVWRLLKSMFGNKKTYEQACQNGTLEPTLKIANREGAEVFQGSRPPKERSTEDPEIDLN
jgi:hypothetical protein